VEEVCRSCCRWFGEATNDDLKEKVRCIYRDLVGHKFSDFRHLWKWLEFAPLCTESTKCQQSYFEWRRIRYYQTRLAQIVRIRFSEDVLKTRQMLLWEEFVFYTRKKNWIQNSDFVTSARWINKAIKLLWNL
jgi:hypothetical protein